MFVRLLLAEKNQSQFKLVIVSLYLRFSPATFAAADVPTLVGSAPRVLPKQSHKSTYVPSASIVSVPRVKAKPVWVLCSQLHPSS